MTVAAPSSLVASARRVSKKMGRCARRLAKSSSLRTAAADERIVGLGICADWLYWATFAGLEYTGPKRNRERMPATTEVARFTFLWTAATALLARRSLLSLVDPELSSRPTEEAAFAALYRAADLEPRFAARHAATINSIIGMPESSARIPWVARSAPITFGHVMYHKYTPAQQRSTGVGKKLGKAISAGSYQALDLSTRVSGTMSWVVDGALIPTSFRGCHQKFLTYMNAGTRSSLRCSTAWPPDYSRSCDAIGATCCSATLPLSAEPAIRTP